MLLMYVSPENIIGHERCSLSELKDESDGILFSGCNGFPEVFVVPDGRTLYTCWVHVNYFAVVGFEGKEGKRNVQLLRNFIRLFSSRREIREKEG